MSEIESQIKAKTHLHIPKVYIEISNICNLQCTFCPEVLRDKKIMDSAHFSQVLESIKPFTDEITLHLMGEPLAHPEFKQIYQIVADKQIPLHLTTNGLLTSRYETLFLSSSHSPLKQINFSVQSYLDNYPNKDPIEYLNKLVQFSLKLNEPHPHVFINFRLWNALSTENIPSEALPLIEFLENEFKVSLPRALSIKEKKSWKLTHKIRIHWDTRFEWPSLQSTHLSTHGYCHGLSQHIGIHADGTVVPCCLDKEAVISLGNIFNQTLPEILTSPRAINILNAFKNNKAHEELCLKCTYKNRFNRTLL